MVQGPAIWHKRTPSKTVLVPVTSGHLRTEMTESDECRIIPDQKIPSMQFAHPPKKICFISCFARFAAFWRFTIREMPAWSKYSSEHFDLRISSLPHQTKSRRISRIVLCGRRRRRNRNLANRVLFKTVSESRVFRHGEHRERFRGEFVTGSFAPNSGTVRFNQTRKKPRFPASAFVVLFALFIRCVL